MKRRILNMRLTLNLKLFPKRERLSLGERGEFEFEVLVLV